MTTLGVLIEEEIPRLRGMIHMVAAPLILLLGAALALRAPTLRAAIAIVIMTIGYTAIFGTSGTYHRLRCSPRTKRIWRHLDHAMIFIGIAAIYTALWTAVLDGLVADILLVYVWLGSLIGVMLKLRFIDARPSRHAFAYLVFALVGVAILPSMVQSMPLTPIVLLLAGALSFALGALAFSTQRPNPIPGLIGHHEVFHIATVIGALLHVAALAFSTYPV